MVAMHLQDVPILRLIAMTTTPAPLTNVIPPELVRTLLLTAMIIMRARLTIATQLRGVSMLC